MKILVVEDEKKIANSIKRGFEQEKIIVDVAYDGTKGYDLAVSESYDVIILDLMLPGIDGLEICRNLRKNRITIPILMLTARSFIEDKVTGLNCGADDYLTKPFDFEELLARIKALARRPKQVSANIIECDNLKMDLTNLNVRRKNKLIELSKKEYELLEYLIRNKNRIVTKEELMTNVWEFDSDILPNTVEVYIGYLRNKIDRPFKTSNKLIKTLRGFGYKLSDE